MESAGRARSVCTAAAGNSGFVDTTHDDTPADASHDQHATDPTPDRPRDPKPVGRQRLVRMGRYAWAVIGVAGVVALTAALAYWLSLIVIPLILALFAAAALAPVARWLRHRSTPPALAALLSLLMLLGGLALVIGVLVPVVRSEAPNLMDSLVEGIEGVDELLRREPLGMGLRGVDDVVDRLTEQFGSDEEDGAVQVAVAGVEAVVGLVLMLVATFFYLKDGTRFGRALQRLLPTAARAHVAEMARRAWGTLGGYLRGLLLVALFDAVLIGAGLLLLGVPLALPLAVLVLFGGFFPVIGAVVTGGVAVLVAFAAGGVGTALAVLALVVGVQQLESNVLQPFVVGRVIALHPFVVLLAITGGGVAFGVLGAFLAVPAAASVARAGEYAQEAGLLEL